MSGYTDVEIDAIKGWLVEGCSAARIAELFCQKFRRSVSRNAIIGIVHRNAALAAIGLPGRKPVGPGKRRARQRKPSAPAAPGSSHFGYLPRRDLVRDIGEAFAPDREVSDLHAARPPKVRARIDDPAGYDRDSMRLPLLALRGGQCRFPVNDARPGEEHLFCGHPAQPGKSYCLHHLARAVSSVFTASGPAALPPDRACEPSHGLRSKPRPSAGQRATDYALKLGRA